MKTLHSRISLRIALLLSALSALWLAGSAAAQGYLPGDFIVSDYAGKIAVFDRNLVFKNYLDTNFNLVGGLDFTSTGQLVAVGRIPGTIRRYNSSGALIKQIVNDAAIANPIDVKVGPNNLLYVGTQSAAVPELSLTGTVSRTFGTLQDPEGIAVLPNGELWVGHGSDGPIVPNPIQVFSLATGALTRTIPLDNGAQTASAMFHSAATNTVLMTDPFADMVYERRIDGSLVRQFNSDTQFPYGITRADNGNVYVTGQFSNFIARFDSHGAFVGSTTVSPYIDNPIGIVQVPVPEPASQILLCLGLLGLQRVARRRATAAAARPRITSGT